MAQGAPASDQGAGGIPTQGEISYSSLATQSVSYGIGVLSRLSAASVDPYTLLIGTGLTRRFPLAPVGRDNVNKALKHHKTVSAFHKALWIGLGVESIPMQLNKTEQGQSLMALCASASMCVGVECTANILTEIAASHPSSDNMNSPSPEQWAKVVSCCEGALSGSSFEARLQTFLNFSNTIHTTQESLTEAADLAKALLGIANIVTKSSDSILLIGAASSCWIACIAEWLFGLRVRITDSQTNNTVVYENFEEHLEPQVSVALRPPEHERSRAIVTHETYVLDNFTEWFESGSPGVVIYDSVPLDRCLNSAFGQYFRRVLMDVKRFGKLFGSASRIYQAAAAQELDEWPTSKRAYTAGPFSSISYPFANLERCGGRTLVFHTLKTLPELLPARTHMETAAAVSLSAAIAEFEKAMDYFRNQCDCQKCQAERHMWRKARPRLESMMPSLALVTRFRKVQGATQADEQMDPSQLDPNDPDIKLRDATDAWKSAGTSGSPRGSCLPSLALAIITLAHVLAGIDLLPGLGLSRKTIENWFSMTQNNRTSSWTWEELFHYSSCLSYTSDGLSIALELAAGLDAKRYQAQPRRVCAEVRKGVCAFYGSLKEMSSDPDAVGVISVMPGRIHWRQRPYEICQDESQDANVSPSLNDYETFKSSISAAATVQQHQMLIKEAVGGLKVRYRFDDGPKYWPQYIGPLEIVHGIFESRRLPRRHPGCAVEAHRANKSLILSEAIPGSHIIEYQREASDRRAILVRNLESVATCFFIATALYCRSFQLKNIRLLRCCPECVIEESLTGPGRSVTVIVEDDGDKGYM